MPKRLLQIARVKFQTVRATQTAKHPGITLLRFERGSNHLVPTRGGEEQQSILHSHAHQIAADRASVKFCRLDGVP